MCRLYHMSLLLVKTGDLCRFHYTMMAWLPTYFTDTLSLSLTQAAQVRSLQLILFRRSSTNAEQVPKG